MEPRFFKSVRRTTILWMASICAFSAGAQQPAPPTPPQKPSLQGTPLESGRMRRPFAPGMPRWADGRSTDSARPRLRPPWFRGGPGGSPPSALTLERWEHADRQLTILRQMFADNDRRRSELIDTLTAKKQGYEPGAMDPGNLLKRQQIEELLIQSHGLMDRDRRTAEEAAEILEMASRMREQWEDLLRRQLADSQSTTATVKVALPLPKERYEAWLAGAERLRAGDREGYFRAVLGNLLGPAACRVPRRLPPEEIAAEAMQDTTPTLEVDALREARDGPPASAQDRWLHRIERIQHRQSELANQVRRQQKEIERLRALLAEKAPEALAPQGRPGETWPGEPED